MAMSIAFVCLHTDEEFQVIEENGVKLTLSVTDTPGFGDQVNNDNAYVLPACLDGRC